MNLRVNQLIDIGLDIDSEKKEYLPSRIEEITDDYLIVSMPMKKGEIVPLRIGTTIEIVCHFEDNTYSFYTTILDRKREPIPVFLIAKPQHFTKIQRREFVRVPVNLPIKISTDDGQSFFDGITMDISAGGVLAKTKLELEANQIILLEITLPQRKPIYLKSRIVRILEKARTVGKTCKVAIEYDEISAGDRDRIFNFIFEKQREWIKKGLLS